MPTLARGDVTLAFDEIGTGFPVMLHTGGAGSGSMWRGGGYAERLGEFRLILIDHRGRGRSDRPTDLASHHLDAYVADVVALADSLELPRYAFVGYSFGAAVGLRVALADSRVAALVSLGAVFDPPRSEPEPSDYQAPVETAGMDGLIATVEQQERLTLPGWLRREFSDTDAEQFRLTIAANAAEVDPWQDLGSLRMPVVLIAGAEEDPDLVQDQMASAIPDARSMHLPGAGHVGAFLRPDEVVAAALPTLRRGAADHPGQTRISRTS
jgi:pimeloyl-ACP methyl ester carboxylesterase